MQIDLNSHKIEDITVLTFSVEIYFQVQAALHAHLKFMESIRSYWAPQNLVLTNLSLSDVIRIGAEEFLMRCANLARIFSNKRSQERCSILRNALSIDLDNPIFNTSVRNILQHNDEHLDRLVNAFVEHATSLDHFSTKVDVNSDGTFFIRWYEKHLNETDVAKILNELRRLENLLEELNPYLAKQ